MGSVLNIKKTNKTFSISQKDGKGPDTNFLVQCLSKSVVDGYICYVIFGSLKNLDEIIDSLFYQNLYSTITTDNLFLHFLMI